MRTLFFLFQNGNGPGKPTSACDSPNPPFWCDNFEPEPVASIDEASYWIAGIITFISLIYFFYGVYKAYRIFYKQPKKNSKWLQERFPEDLKDLLDELYPEKTTKA